MGLFNWIEDRTGVGKILKAALYEPVPGGARWRYVWGSTLTFAIVVQFITGIVMWANYSPSSQTAWESVFFMEQEMGGLVIPGVIALILFLMPFLARLGRWGHRFNLIFLALLLSAITGLTVWAYIDDARNPDYQFAVEQADKDANRVKELARFPEGIPPVGAMVILQSDPLTQGPRIFASKCASCHTYQGHDGLGRPQKEPSAPDLHGMGTREWLAGFLDPEQIETPKYFFGTAFVEPDDKGKKSRMIEYVHELADLSDQGRAELEKIIAAVSAEAELPQQLERDAADSAIIEEGTDLFFTGIAGVSESCADCHSFDGEESEAARTPDLTGWSSRQWLIDFTRNPEHPRFYGSANDRMPIFEEERIFTDKEIELVVDWLRGDWVKYEENADLDPASEEGKAAPEELANPAP